MSAVIPVEVSLGAAPRGREDALRLVGALLAQAGHIEAAYVDSLLRREKVGHTFLGQGLAIPHGMLEDKHLVRRTALAVLQVPAGVNWSDVPGADQVVRLVVAIAAAGDEHLQVLRRLTRVMRDDALMQRLVTTAQAQDIVRALTSDELELPTAVNALEDFALGCELALNYPSGLHARPAAQWARVAAGFQARVHVRYQDTVVDAKSVAALLGLGAPSGAQLRLSAQGVDAAPALAALQALIVSLTDEESRQFQLNAARQQQALGLGRALGDWQPQAAHSFTGLAAAPGLTLGTLVLLDAPTAPVKDCFTSLADEAAALDDALTAARHELEQLVQQARAAGHIEQLDIFTAHQDLLQDAALLQATGELVVQRHGAAWAWQQALTKRVAAQRALADATLAARGADLQDVGQRVLRHLLGQAMDATAGAVWPPDAILLADDISPSMVAQLDAGRLRGFCTAGGGPTGHSAILARAQGVPAVVAVGSGVLGQAAALQLAGQTVILDGYRGCLYVAPSAAALTQARAHMQQLAQLQAEQERASQSPAATADGWRIEIGANVNRAQQVSRALVAGAEGVGLMRTEFLFLERDSSPSEEQQYQAYRAMLEALAGRPLLVRTLDIGGDKQVAHLNLPLESNPFLGLRGARLTLRRDDLMLPQLRALCRASAHGPLQIIFPMISTIEEVIRLRELTQQVCAELQLPVPLLGIMIEVPSAALMAEKLAAHVDFFSIGTNDLTQYTLAVDRQHPELAHLADSLHPAVLRLIERSVVGARSHKRWVGVCGGLAGDPLGAALLVGLGVNELSMGASDIGAVKAMLRRHSLAQLQDLAQRALAASNADEVRALGAVLASSVT